MLSFSTLLLLGTSVLLVISIVFLSMTLINLHKIERIKQEDWERLSVPNFWGTVEATSWARNFSYAEYLANHIRERAQGAPLSQAAYSDLFRILTNSLGRKP